VPVVLIGEFGNVVLGVFGLAPSASGVLGAESKVFFAMKLSIHNRGVHAAGFRWVYAEFMHGVRAIFSRPKMQ
jgi:hypothetical protein